jgi:hypothetical protein
MADAQILINPRIKRVQGVRDSRGLVKCLRIKEVKKSERLSKKPRMS